MEPTPKPICQLIAGKTSAAVTPAIRGEHGKENHVDLVDDLSSYIGRQRPEPFLDDIVCAFQAIPTLEADGRLAENQSAFTTNTEGDTRCTGPPGVCPDCRQLDFKGDRTAWTKRTTRDGRASQAQTGSGVLQGPASPSSASPLCWSQRRLGDS
uniref:Uncharacterized protein n=1 Tax=Macrostomum lignano TaxID=282301 RepID=A0A1I8JQU4_9PLAT